MNKIKNTAFVPLYEKFRREIKLAGKQPKTIDSYARSLKCPLSGGTRFPNKIRMSMNSISPKKGR